MSIEPTNRIIRLKRYEQPPEGYFDDFLIEFQKRQRAELLRPSIGALILQRLNEILTEIRVPAMAYAGAAAVAIVASVLILGQPGPQATPRAYAATYRQTPVTVPSMQPVSLRVEAPTADRFDSLFPPSYILRPRAANHESPISF
jgi:hypothetical protein